MIATTKERLLLYIDKKGISKSQFYNDLDIKRGLLDADKLKATITDTIIAKILVVYTDLNINWLLTGVGEMLREEKNPEKCETVPSKLDESLLRDMFQSLQEEKKRVVEEKEKKIEELMAELRAMERKVGKLEAELEHAAALGSRTAENASTVRRSSQSRASAHSASAHSNE